MSDDIAEERRRPDTPLADGEVETLLGFLEYQRATLEWKCSGLTDEQLRSRLAPTVMTLAGLLKHVARVEDYWFGEVVAEGPALEPWASMPWADEWANALADTGDDLRRQWADRMARSRQIVADRLAAGESALDTTYSAWDGEGRASLRWILTHMIEEYARHNGHADLLREAIDGETGE